MRIAIAPGSFDPMTLGHVNIIERAATLFDKVYVAVMVNENKKYTFDSEERTEIARASCKHIPNVEVIYDGGMLADLAKRLDACAIVKGLRDENDYRYETEMARYNTQKNPNIQTVFLPCEDGAREISSTAVRRRIASGEDITSTIAADAVPIIKAKAAKAKREF